ncbi:MAG: hypothetical protein HYZ75_09015 [Elusimicrobia bacterium]|nr:hypothetical protein [Elusimicrobiota bacterium]
MKLLMLALAAGLFVRAQGNRPVPPPAPSAPISQKAARTVELQRVARQPILTDFEKRALSRTVGDSQARMRRLLAEFGEPEGVELAAAIARHPGLQDRLIDVFASPEVRRFTRAADGTPMMTIKRI